MERVQLLRPGGVAVHGEAQDRLDVEVGDDLIVYYGAADVSVAAARVNKRDLVDSLERAIELGQGGVPL